MRKYLIFVIAVMMIISMFSVVAYADSSNKGNDSKGPKDNEKKQSDKGDKWIENQTQIDQKKDEIEAKKEAFFSQKDQTSQQIDDQKDLIKEQKELIIEQVHLINELNSSEKSEVKEEIQGMWEQVRNTQRFMWEIRQMEQERTRECYDDVIVQDSNIDDIDSIDIDNIISDIMA